jgi:hypothetical protein
VFDQKAGIEERAASHYFDLSRRTAARQIAQPIAKKYMGDAQARPR